MIAVSIGLDDYTESISEVRIKPKYINLEKNDDLTVNTMSKLSQTGLFTNLVFLKLEQISKLST